MRSFNAFLTCLFIIFIASCSKEANIYPETQIEQSISDRSTTTVVQVTVASSEESDGTFTVEFSGAPNGAEPAFDQTLVFNASSETVAHNLPFIGYQNIGGNLLIDFDASGVDLEGLDIQSVQSIIIDDVMFE